MQFKSTKHFDNLPCAHQQHFDADESGIPGTGECAKTHGYSRSFTFEFSCEELDENGWVVGFSSLKKVKAWLDYMFDHTSLWEANDPRLAKVQDFNDHNGIYNMRVLPSGVSMEQTAIFVAMVVNPHILKETDHRCWVSKLEVRENIKNSGIIEGITKSSAQSMWNAYCKLFGDDILLPKRDIYPYVSPKSLISLIKV